MPYHQITMVNDVSVSFDGTARVQFCTAGSKASYTVPVYILKNSSHPFILSITYMRNSGIVLGFSKACLSAVSSSTKFICDHSFVLPPNSETIVQGKVHKDLHIGIQGQCLGHNEMARKGFLVSKVVDTCLSDYHVQLKS